MFNLFAVLYYIATHMFQGVHLIYSEQARNTGGEESTESSGKLGFFHLQNMTFDTHNLVRLTVKLRFIIVSEQTLPNTSI